MSDGRPWRRGDRVHDDDYRLSGTIEDVGTTIDDEPVLYVRWDDGTQAVFVPDDRTQRTGGAT